ncbi:MAG: MFS transporter [Chitinophagaceae bacterium]|jgi:predicted MFS family arabinose efflux permease|nr:MFS transporter [Chitinophagaceae bacterium]MBK8300024.1 MFS transporter [Chitinophagaceae bacterium]MBK9658813.1 MFS transporter [Chitinophagaceae bacterium]MBK9939549.1 MFS transporter [Chitinophagaceae bacterium]MBL0067266.1 MFS transporter [Chitinophagaceae bacterium]
MKKNEPAIQPGLKENKQQFGLLVLVNAFVGAMIGLERAVLPGLGKNVFGLDANAAILSFIIAFGITKAISNYSVAKLSKRFNRKQILMAGWWAALPVPFLLMYADSWSWVIAANILLGINQGLAWSSTVIMKVDIVGQKNRGLAMGINEFAGYLSVGLASYLASSLASNYGYAYFPFIPGLFFAAAGLLVSAFLIKDTTHFVHAESAVSKIALLKNIWKDTTWRHKNISSVTLNGLVNNMNDAVVWGLLPVLLLQKDFSIQEIGIIAGIYPAVWGVMQLFTGKMGDVYCKKQIITMGMLTQAVAIVLLAVSSQFILLVAAAVLLGLGTALVYPNFLTVVAESTHPSQRAETLSIFRFWRDSGYVIGALLAGILADIIGMSAAILVIAGITATAGLVAHFRMCCTLKKFYPSDECFQPALY